MKNEKQDNANNNNEISFTDLPDRPSRGGPDDKHAAHAEPGRAGTTSPGGGGGGEAAARGEFRCGVAGAVAGAAAGTICLVLTICQRANDSFLPYEADAAGAGRVAEGDDAEEGEDC